MRQIAAEEQYGKMVSGFEVRKKQRCHLFLHAEKIAPIDIHQCLMNVYKDQTKDVNIVRRWVVRFSSRNSSVRDRPRSRWPCTAVSSRNEECFDQLIYRQGALHGAECQPESSKSGLRRRRPFSQ
jgi:hypothetical protein